MQQLPPFPDNNPPEPSHPGQPSEPGKPHGSFADADLAGRLMERLA